MSVVLPIAARIYPSLWFSPRGDWRFGTRLSSRSLLHRLLLGGNGAPVCRWRHESLLDRGLFSIDISREGRAIWPACAAACGDCLHDRRGLVAYPGCLIRCPLLALSGPELVRCTCLLLTQSGHRCVRLRRRLLQLERRDDGRLLR